MICPKCEAEYVEGIKICSDCDVELITIAEFESNLVHHDDWISVYSTDVFYEAEMIKANLEGADIKSIILSQQDKNFPASGDLSVIKIMVKKDDEIDAKSIISDTLK